MEIGTHNSMTYLPLKKWWMYPFNWIAKCQSKTIEEQFNKGVRLFDIRVAYDKDNNLEFRHGLISYKGDVCDILEFLNKKNVPIKIRLILEKDCNEKMFGLDAALLEAMFPNLIFYEGRRKSDWKQLIDFPTLEINQLIGSMSGKGLFKIWPRLYALFHNKTNLTSYKDNKPVLIDFI